MVTQIKFSEGRDRNRELLSLTDGVIHQIYVHPSRRLEGVVEGQGIGAKHHIDDVHYSIALLVP